MAIKFVCPSCKRPLSVDDSQGGKQARCQCGAITRIPGGPGKVPAATAAATPDLDGLDDDEPASSSHAPGIDDALDSALARRRSGTRTAASRRHVQQGPWGLPIRRLAVGSMCAALAGQVSLQSSPALRERAPAALSMVIGVVAILGVVTTLISVLGALFSYLNGNREAFAGESTTAQVGWFLSSAFAVLLAGLLGLQLARPNAGRGMPAPPPGMAFNPGAPAAVPGMPPGPGNPGFAFGGGSSTRVIENGRYEKLVQDFDRSTFDLATVISSIRPEIGAASLQAQIQAGQRRTQQVMDEARRLPHPGPEKSAELGKIFRNQVRDSMQRYRDSCKDTANRLAAQPERVQTLQAMAQSTDQAIQKFDATEDFYTALFGDIAGTAASQPPGAEELPAFIQQSRERSQVRREALQAGPTGPPGGIPGGPPAGPRFGPRGPG